jgi:hypothetical protein
MSKGVAMAKIAISLPDEVLNAVEKERSASGISRSEYFRRTVEEHLHREKEKEDVARYIQGYRDDPETLEELDWVVQAGVEALADIPWEDSGEK